MLPGQLGAIRAEDVLLEVLGEHELAVDCGLYCRVCASDGCADMVLCQEGLQVVVLQLLPL